MARTYRSSLERHNAPYRGTTSREDTVNFDLSVMHDLTHIEVVSGGNEKIAGHKDSIEENFSAIYHEEGLITASIPTAGKLVSRKHTLSESIFDGWTLTGGATRKKELGWKSETLTGVTHQDGIKKIVSLEAGEILVLRVKLTAKTGSTGTHFSFGAKTINQGEEDLQTLATIDFLENKGKRAGAYIEKRLYSESRQDVEVVFHAIEGAQGNTTLLMTDFSLSLYSEQDIKVSGLDSSIKGRISGTTDHLEFLEDQILKQRGDA